MRITEVVGGMEEITIDTAIVGVATGIETATGDITRWRTEGRLDVEGWSKDGDIGRARTQLERRI